MSLLKIVGEKFPPSRISSLEKQLCPFLALSKSYIIMPKTLHIVLSCPNKKRLYCNLLCVLVTFVVVVCFLCGGDWWGGCYLKFLDLDNEGFFL